MQVLIFLIDKQEGVKPYVTISSVHLSHGSGKVVHCYAVSCKVHTIPTLTPHACNPGEQEVEIGGSKGGGQVN